MLAETREIVRRNELRHVGIQAARAAQVREAENRKRRKIRREIRASSSMGR